MLAAIWVAGAAARGGEPATFQRLGGTTVGTDGTVSYLTRPQAISADGSVIAGTAGVDLPDGGKGSVPFRWTRQGGLQLLNGLTNQPGLNLHTVAGVSSDGSVVAGYAATGDSTYREPFRWTAQGGTVPLGRPAGSPVAYVEALSRDGSTAVGFGRGYETDPNPAYQAFRWIQATGSASLGGLAGYPQSTLTTPVTAGSAGSPVSADGSVVVGSAFGAGPIEAFRWTASGGTRGLGDIAGGPLHSSPLAVSANGLVTVGFGTPDDNNPEAVRWTADGTLVRMGRLPGHTYSGALFVSDDGSVVAGLSGNPTGAAGGDSELWRWTPRTGMVSLGVLPTIAVPRAWFLEDGSADGNVLVGFVRNQSDFDNQAFVWDVVHGMRKLDDVLRAGGARFDGWALAGDYDARTLKISDDGTTITGLGRNPDGQLEGWVATIAPVPEPVALAVVALAGFGALVRRRR